MLNHFLFIVASLFSATCFADKLRLEIEAKDIFVNGSFAYHPGGTLKISGKDTAGSGYTVEVKSKIEKEEFVQFVCLLNHDGHKQSVSIVTKKGEEGTITSGPKDGPP